MQMQLYCTNKIYEDNHIKSQVKQKGSVRNVK